MAITQAENDLLTQTDKGTPMGELFRRYWFPAMLSERLPEREGRPVAVELLGEKLVAFRDRHGEVFVVDEFCPHRRASLAYARCEDGGLRCIFHGWLIGGDGEAWEAPPERYPEKFARNVHTTAYRTHEAGGIVWVYMGEGTPPPPPDFSFMGLDDAHIEAVHYHQECNYLQGIEADVDLVHSAYLHSSVSRNETAQAGSFRVSDVLANDGAPRPHVHDAEWGFYNVWEYTTPDPDRKMVWIHPFIFPFFTIVAPSRRNGTYLFHAWVPINDREHWFYFVHYHPDKAMDAAEREAITELFGHDKLDKANDYRSTANLANHHLQDAGLIKDFNYSGITGIAAQDIAVLQSMQPIVDRTREHLGTEDATVRWLRTRLMNAARAFQKDGGPVPEPQGDTGRGELDGFIRIVDRDHSWKEIVMAGATETVHLDGSAD
jgi:phthalate 4,5-dioxygenase